MNNLLKLLLGIIFLFQALYGNVTWTTPVTISGALTNALNQRVAMDSSGNAIAIWEQNGNIHTKTLLLGGSWSSDTGLSSSGTASNPQIVIDPAGNATAVWVDNGVIKWASGSTTGSWSINGAISNTGASNPQIAVDTAGDVVVVWEASGFIRSKTKLFGGSFPATADVISLTGADTSRVAIGANGTVVAVWHGTVAGVNTIYAATKAVNGTWGSPTVISNSSIPSVNARVAVDLNGNAIAIWYRYAVSGTTFSQVMLQAASLPFGGSWGSPIDISTTPGIYNPGLLSSKIAFDSNGNAIALWGTSVDGARFDIVASVKPTTNNGIIGIDQQTQQPVINAWTAPISIIVDNQFGYGFDLALSSNGDGFIAFMSFNSFTNVISTSSFEIQVPVYQLGFTGDQEQISNGTIDGFPRIAGALISNTHNLVAVWSDYNGTNYSVQASSGTGNAIQGPTNLVITQGQNSYGFFTDKFNQLSWNASPSLNIAQYKVFRNGTFIQQVSSSSSLQIVDDNRFTGEIDTYGVIAVDSAGFESAPVFITAPAVP